MEDLEEYTSHRRRREVKVPSKERQGFIIKALRSGKYKVDVKNGKVFHMSPVSYNWIEMPEHGLTKYKFVRLRLPNDKRLNVYVIHLVWMEVHGAIPEDVLIIQKNPALKGDYGIDNLCAMGVGAMEEEVTVFDEITVRAPEKRKIASFSRRLKEKDIKKIREVMDVNPKVNSVQMAMILRCPQKTAAYAMRKIRKGLKMDVEGAKEKLVKDEPWMNNIGLSDLFITDLEQF